MRLRKPEDLEEVVVRELTGLDIRRMELIGEGGCRWRGFWGGDGGPRTPGVGVVTS